MMTRIIGIVMRTIATLTMERNKTMIVVMETVMTTVVMTNVMVTGVMTTLTLTTAQMVTVETGAKTTMMTISTSTRTTTFTQKRIFLMMMMIMSAITTNAEMLTTMVGERHMHATVHGVDMTNRNTTISMITMMTNTHVTATIVR